jgi:lon-related putative ATP-dependent protease
MTVKALDASALCQRCNPEEFDFKTTADLEQLAGVIGQPRAVEAVKFGISIRRDGYNLFALGPTGTGKQSLVETYTRDKAAGEPPPSDWCYVNNFQHSHKPTALELPFGKGTDLQKGMDQLVEELRSAIPAAFESEDYRARMQAIEEELKEKQEGALERIHDVAKDRGIALIRTPSGFAFAPTKKGEVLSPEAFSDLPEKDRERIESDVSELQKELQKTLHQIPQWKKETRDKVKELNQEIATYAVRHAIEDLKKSFSDLKAVQHYLDAVQQDVIDHVDDFRKSDEEGPSFLGISLSTSQSSAQVFNRYKVNVLVGHEDHDGAPVIHEDNPNYSNLIGRVEHLAQLGALVTDFTMIKPGALHRANGGYLILDAQKVLLQPYAWEGIKRALRSKEIRMESLGQMLSLVSTVSLEPEPIPLNVKVVLMGDRYIYYLLSFYDPEFSELFKVAADFDDRMDWNPENNQLYARMISTLVHKEKLRHFDKHAVARVIEHSARLVEDSEKLSTHMRNIADLVREADYWAGEAGREVASAEDVEKAIDARIYRSDRVRERIQEEIRRGTIYIDTEGGKVGQVNGLTVMMLGDFAFGQPARITARVRMGDKEVIDIEREVELGGPIHSKGVMILNGYLGERYVQDKPLVLSASLVMEQSYGEVEGDSASSTELYALLSALSEVPIKQTLAVTGSVNQHGQVQPIGGVNEKIEGFFDVCRARGLSGEQGVLIPESNIKHLMLRRDVVEAVRDGKFHIYPVHTIDEGIELLTGMPAGERDEQGNFPEGTINYLVESRLVFFSEKMHAFATAAKDRDDSHDSDEEDHDNDDT